TERRHPVRTGVAAARRRRERLSDGTREPGRHPRGKKRPALRNVRGAGRAALTTKAGVTYRRPEAYNEGMTFSDAAEAHLDDVYGYLAWFTGDRAAADDLAGETFERALRLWHRFDPERGSAKTWLCQVARTTALDHFR